jgi:hypothetical protein
VWNGAVPEDGSVANDPHGTKPMRPSFRLSQHASRRLNQRGIRRADFSHFLHYADCETNQRNGASAMRLSKDSIGEALEAGLDPDTVRRIASLCAVVGGSTVITQYRGPLPRRHTLRRGVGR